MQEKITTESQPFDKKKALHRQHLQEIGDGKIGTELLHVILSRHKLIYLVSQEERRVIDCLKHIANGYNLEMNQWDLKKGMIDSLTGNQLSSSNAEIHKQAVAAVNYVLDEAKDLNKKLKESESVSHSGKMFVFFDLHHHFNTSFPSPALPFIERTLKEFESTSSTACIIVVNNAFVCPSSLSNYFAVLDFPYPSEAELDRSARTITKQATLNFPNIQQEYQTKKQEILSSVKGLTLTEAENAWAKSLVATKSFDIRYIIGEKKQAIRKSGVLEYINPQFTFDDIGGLENLKKWIKLRKNGFSKEARNFGIDTPKGLLLIGVPGTGKTLSCFAASLYYQVPFLRLDMSSLYGSLLGESEGRMKAALKQAESLSPCVLQLDEIDKGISGTGSSNQTDGGVTSRLFGSLLTWLQEKTASVFVMATANNHNAIPVEFLRAGRFDEIFFVDLPHKKQRKEVLSCLIKRKKRDINNFDLDLLAEQSQDYSPSELEKAINNSLFEAFENKTELSTELILKNIKSFFPLYQTKKDEIEAMRTWALGEDGAGGRAILASEVNKEDTPIGAINYKNSTTKFDNIVNIDNMDDL